ncbi:hypothetical protein HMPREF3173_16115 [Pseudomonas sp. HMSC08G10]|uniref:hypothetical protein n=1 Tax=Pseudomonas sp. HMSC08G10 TaxID=1581141 RepID=UPI0008A4C1D3|nr:hypothetical protein [Pseudomonas sp. HMSC08G10]OFS72059.1 hypothetical protein HMPREF3173_16115 [Pseudomonas sp. HMSC08G10]
MKRLALVALVGLVLAGCGKSDIDRAREAVAAQLKDPASAQFRNERVVGDDRTVCGEVNGRNSAGGYAGFTSYAALRKDDGSYMALLESDGQKVIVSSTCK